MNKTKKSLKGFTVVETILAAVIFVIISAGAITAILQGLDSNLLGEEQAVATQYASEGIEAVRSIKNQNFSNLVNSVGTGVLQSSGVWGFSGANNIFGSKYTRVVKVEDVQRDGSGNIVASGGTVDTDSKKITSTVNWLASPSRSNSVVLSTYLTNYRKLISVSGGLIIYGDGTTTPKYRTYDPSVNTFSSELSTILGSSGNSFGIKSSPAKRELVAGYVTSSGVLQVMCFDGSSWSNEWSTTVGGTASTKRFDISYETNSGDVLVAYSTNTATTNELAYRTKLGGSSCGSGNWSSATSFNPVRTSGVVQWVKMASDRRTSSNLIAMIWADANRDLSAAIWNGTAFVNEPSAATETSLEIVSTAQDVDSFDVEYESLSGDVMVVWGNSAGSNGANGVRYRTCPGGISTCTWGAVTTPPTFADDATNLDISASPTTDEIAFASIGNAGSDLQLGYWSGSAWTNLANADTSCTTPTAGRKKVATGWVVLSGTTYPIAVYDDQGAGSVRWYYRSGGTWTKNVWTPTPSFSSNQGWYQIEMNPNDNSELMLVVTDNSNDLFAKRLLVTAGPTFTWSNSDSSVALELTLPQVIASPFSFSYYIK